MKYILSLDQGTTSSRAIIFDENAEIVSKSQKEFKQIFPKPGWVEHDANEIWESQLEVARKAIQKANIDIHELECIGITNQRETTVVWDISTGQPIYNAIVWQDRRTADQCHQLSSEGWTERINQKTGLVIDAYFSATKVKWLIDNVPGAREKAKNGHLAFGTIDSWLVYKLTNHTLHVTDFSNASRTMLFNINNLSWDEELLDLFEIPKSMLPEVVDSSGIIGESDKEHFSKAISISGIAGDQQAALFGQKCFEKGAAKNTYGTGCFMLMNTGNKRIHSESGLLSTIAWSLEGKAEYALEGSVFNAGSVVQWLRDELELIENAQDTDAIASSLKENDGVYLVPAFTGLGAPYWNMDAKASIVGLTRGSGKAHIVRASLESIAYQTKEIFDLMISESKIDLKLLKVDGGASENQFLMQFQSDILNVPIQRAKTAETTALGAAFLAGIAHNIFSKNDLSSSPNSFPVIQPAMEKNKREKLFKNWLSAVKSCLTYK